MPEIAQVCTDIQVEAFSYSMGQPWIQVEGRLLIDGGMWVRFTTTVPINEAYEDASKFAAQLQSCIHNRALQLQEDEDDKSK